MKKAAVVFLAAIVVFAPALSRGAWLDDWFDQAISSGPDYFAGQKRGFVSAGSFSARWSVNRDYPVTLALPRFNAGCGGIDVFLGGMSFAMLPEYLVQKFQALISAAPAIAFQVALSVLNEKLSNKLDVVEHIINALNSLQFDECRASQAIVAKLMDTAGLEEYVPEEFVKAAQEMGISDLWKKAIEENSGKPLSSTDPSFDEVIQGCPADFKSLVKAGSVVYWVLQRKNYPGAQSLAEFIRGYVGDVKYENHNWVFVEPCSENKAGDIESLIDGTGYVRDLAGTCKPASAGVVIGGRTYTSIRDWVATRLVALMEQIAGGDQLDADTEAFVRMIPASVYSALKAAAVAGQADAVIPTYVELISKGFAWRIMADLYSTAKLTEATAYKIVTGAVTETENCKKDVAQKLIAELQRVRESAYRLSILSRQQYAAVLEELVTTLQYGQMSALTERKVRQILAEALGHGVGLENRR